jgi:hypothetical protein
MRRFSKQGWVLAIAMLALCALTMGCGQTAPTAVEIDDANAQAAKGVVTEGGEVPNWN